MKYYLVVGEASGDLHAAHLMRELKNVDPKADFRFFGGDNMSEVGGTLVRHYRDTAYMGFFTVVTHLPSILRNMALCKEDIRQWRPDAVVLVDYPGFNLDIAKYVHANKLAKVFYYISPKIWAWKEHRIKNIKRDVDELFSILPFEVDFFERKHHYPIHYVGNPTADEVGDFKGKYDETFLQFCQRNHLPEKPIVALLAGSRKTEIKDNLPKMMRVMDYFPECQFVLAGAPSIDDDFYTQFISGTSLSMVHNDTFALLANATAALVTSGTATLETALFNVPQVVCYATPVPHFWGFLKRHLLKVKYISLVNLIADKEVVPELVADSFTHQRLVEELGNIMPGKPGREAMLEGYGRMREAIGKLGAPSNAARLMVSMLSQ
ncbi:MAG: lipid-A-disaccharide synthase [Prevotella sp.]|nr:lipid-A-disaccharide synthase [Prevotella sp.]